MVESIILILILGEIFYVLLLGLILLLITSLLTWILSLLKVRFLTIKIINLLIIVLTQIILLALFACNCSKSGDFFVLKETIALSILFYSLTYSIFLKIYKAINNKTVKRFEFTNLPQ